MLPKIKSYLNCSSINSIFRTPSDNSLDQRINESSMFLQLKHDTGQPSFAINITDLPAETKILVAEYLTPIDLLSTSLVNPNFNHISNKNCLWKNFILPYHREGFFPATTNETKQFFIANPESRLPRFMPIGPLGKEYLYYKGFGNLKFQYFMEKNLISFPITRKEYLHLCVSFEINFFIQNFELEIMSMKDILSKSVLEMHVYDHPRLQNYICESNTFCKKLLSLKRSELSILDNPEIQLLLDQEVLTIENIFNQ